MVMLSAKLPFLSCFQLSFAAFGLAHLRMLPWYKPQKGGNSVKMRPIPQAKGKRSFAPRRAMFLPLSPKTSQPGLFEAS